MCGIVGVLKEKGSQVTYEEFSDFLYMLEKAEQRGRQATGICLICQNGKLLVYKAPIASSLAVNYIRYFKNLRGIIGHTRSSTGGIPGKNKNNHPHEDKNWIVIHNGSVSSNLTYAQMECTTQCDTEEIIRTLSYHESQTNTFEEKVIFKKGLSDLSGSFALCLIRKKTADIYLTTNGKNPLKIMNYPGGLYFASVDLYIKNTGLFAFYKDKDKEIKITQPESEKVFLITDNALLTEVAEYDTASYKNNQYLNFRYNNFGNRDCEISQENYSDFNEFMNKTPSKTNLGSNKRIAARMASNKGITPSFTPQVNFKESSLENILSDRDSILYSSDTGKVTYKYNFTLPEKISIAFKVLLDNPELFSLGKEQEAQIKEKQHEFKSVRRNQKIKLCKPIVRKINHEFNVAFFDAYEDAIDICITDMHIVLTDSSDKHMLPSVFNHFSVWDRILIVKYGLTIDEIEIEEKDLCNFNIKEEKEEEISFVGSKESSFACLECEIKRRVIVNKKGYVLHICPKCNSSIEVLI